MKSPLIIAKDVQESFPDGSPRVVKFNPQDLLWIKGEATKEWTKSSLPFGLEGGGEMSAEDFRIYCIAFSTMRWLHATGIIKDSANILFKTEHPDSMPIEDVDWEEEEKDS